MKDKRFLLLKRDIISFFFMLVTSAGNDHDRNDSKVLFSNASSPRRGGFLS